MCRNRQSNRHEAREKSAVNPRLQHGSEPHEQRLFAVFEGRQCNITCNITVRITLYYYILLYIIIYILLIILLTFS